MPWADCGGMVLTSKRKGRRMCSHKTGYSLSPEVMLLFWYAQKSASRFKLPSSMVNGCEKGHLSFSSCPSSKNKYVILEVQHVAIEPLILAGSPVFKSLLKIQSISEVIDSIPPPPLPSTLAGTGQCGPRPPVIWVSTSVE